MRTGIYQKEECVFERTLLEISLPKYPATTKALKILCENFDIVLQKIFGFLQYLKSDAPRSVGTASRKENFTIVARGPKKSPPTILFEADLETPGITARFENSNSK